jgi:hypothetical protein
MLGGHMGLISEFMMASEHITHIMCAIAVLPQRAHPEPCSLLRACCSSDAKSDIPRRYSPPYGRAATLAPPLRPSSQPCRKSMGLSRETSKEVHCKQDGGAEYSGRAALSRAAYCAHILRVSRIRPSRATTPVDPPLHLVSCTGECMGPWHDSI